MTEKPSSDEIIKIAEKIGEKFFKTRSPWQITHEDIDNAQFKSLHDTLKKQDETLEELKRSNELIIKSQKEYKESSDPMLEWFKQMTWSKKSRIELVKYTGMVTGVILSILAIAAAVWDGLKFLLAHIMLNK